LHSDRHAGATLRSITVAQPALGSDRSLPRRTSRTALRTRAMRCGCRAALQDLGFWSVRGGTRRPTAPLPHTACRAHRRSCSEAQVTVGWQPPVGPSCLPACLPRATAWKHRTASHRSGPSINGALNSAGAACSARVRATAAVLLVVPSSRSTHNRHKRAEQRGVRRHAQLRALVCRHILQSPQHLQRSACQFDRTQDCEWLRIADVG
jgi:hypothetical protein